MWISNGYFRTLGIPLLAGRDFTPEDRAMGSAEGVAIVNERFAREFFGSDALGKVFRSTGRDLRVVGTVGDTKYRFLREETQPIMYIPVTQGGYRNSLFLQVRTSGDPARVLAELGTLVQSIDPRVPVDRIGTMEMQIDEALAVERLLSFLSTLIGAVCDGLGRARTLRRARLRGEAAHARNRHSPGRGRAKRSRARHDPPRKRLDRAAGNRYGHPSGFGLRQTRVVVAVRLATRRFHHRPEILYTARRCGLSLRMDPGTPGVARRSRDGAEVRMTLYY